MAWYALYAPCKAWKEMKRPRNKLGVFINKSKSPRMNRTLRMTNEVWERLGNLAESQDMTRSDLLEAWTLNDAGHGEIMDRIQDLGSHAGHGLVDRAIEILNEGLTFKANAGGKIKAKIREAVSLLEGEK